MNYVIILAGGIGSRFWPLSRRLQPKQFLDICSEKSMIEETIQRISALVKKENIYIAANRIHNRKINECIRNFGIPFENLFFEPESKNTLAPIAVLSRLIYLSDKDAVIAVLPSDHFIRDREKFIKLLAKGIKIAQRGHIVTLGVTPTRPETGYGYIKVKGKSQKPESYYKVEKFTEKPALLKAKEYIKKGTYYWNGGIFIFRPDIILREIQRFVPQEYKIFVKMKNKKERINLWPKLPSISIDYAVMERTDRAVVLPMDFEWIDLGSWNAITELMKKNKDGNIFKGKCLDIGSKDTFVWSDNRLVATVGLDNIIVVNTKDAILVCSKDRAQDVKRLVQRLKLKGLKEQI